MSLNRTALLLILATPLVAETPGHGAGETLLPNGWRLAPAGRHMSMGDLPLAMVESEDGRYLIVASEGFHKPTLTVVDLVHFDVRSKLTLDNAWLGLAWHPDGKRIFCSGGGAGSVQEIGFLGPTLKPLRTLSLKKPTEESFVGGLAISPDGSRLFAVEAEGQLLSAVDLSTGAVLKSVELPSEGYTALLAPDGKTLFVSLWGGARVLLFDPETLEARGEIAVGEHPSALALSKDRLFVACSNTNAVWVVDLASRKATEQIRVALYPDSPPGSTPNALGVSPDGETLLVANADNNAVAVVDVKTPGESVVRGFIPTGWYPTAAQFSRDGRRIFVLSGKGLTSLANPRGGQPGIAGADGQYAGSMFAGSLSVLDNPDAKSLELYTKSVLRLTPYADATRLAPADAPLHSPIPRKVGLSTPIQHVFYVIRENRSYDQVLGDLEKGNGDPSLCLFGEDATPNAHALAREFVTLDNFYVNAEVSYGGHAFSMGGYANDFIEKVWPMNYGDRGGSYLSEGGGAVRNAYGNIAAGPSGYIWDSAAKAGVSVRSWGEFVDRGPDEKEGVLGQKVKASVPGLKDRVDPDYPPFDLKIKDCDRVAIFLEKLKGFEARGDLPRLSIIRLGNDHTAGTKPGYPTPRAMIAENDRALGRLVEGISRSRFWKDSAIFVLEDDAQDGPDHVDAHRSVALLASPFARRGIVDSALYTTAGILRTIELLLGLQPLSQYDASARPLYGSFQDAPVLTPFLHREARVPVDETNDALSAGAAASLAMDFTEADRAPARELNEILWQSVKGVLSPMPPPLRSAFVRPLATKPEDESKSAAY
jgi:YVTN family beta-propeller protein